MWYTQYMSQCLPSLQNMHPPTVLHQQHPGTSPIGICYMKQKSIKISHYCTDHEIHSTRYHTHPRCSLIAVCCKQVQDNCMGFVYFSDCRVCSVSRYRFQMGGITYFSKYQIPQFCRILELLQMQVRMCKQAQLMETERLWFKEIMSTQLARGRPVSISSPTFLYQRACCCSRCGESFLHHTNPTFLAQQVTTC